MKKTEYIEFAGGRRFQVCLPYQQDIIASLEAFCREARVLAASFSITGTVSSCTIGTYDPAQQVYVTSAENTPHEIAACNGTVFFTDDIPDVRASIVLADSQGNVLGGRLFPGTIVFGGEMALQELSGPWVAAVYDEKTGMIFRRKAAEVSASATGNQEEGETGANGT